MTGLLIENPGQGVHPLRHTHYPRLHLVQLPETLPHTPPEHLSPCTEGKPAARDPLVNRGIEIWRASERKPVRDPLGIGGGDDEVTGVVRAGGEVGDRGGWGGVGGGKWAGVLAA